LQRRIKISLSYYLQWRAPRISTSASDLLFVALKNGLQFLTASRNCAQHCPNQKPSSLQRETRRSNHSWGGHTIGNTATGELSVCRAAAGSLLSMAGITKNLCTRDHCHLQKNCLCQQSILQQLKIARHHGKIFSSHDNQLASCSVHDVIQVVSHGILPIHCHCTVQLKLQVHVLPINGPRQSQLLV